MDGHTTDPDHDLLHNIDLSTLDGFGLDRFLPTRDDVQTRVDGNDDGEGVEVEESSKDQERGGDRVVGQVTRRLEEDAEEGADGTTGKRRRVEIEEQDEGPEGSKELNTERSPQDQVQAQDMDEEEEEEYRPEVPEPIDTSSQSLHDDNNNPVDQAHEHAQAPIHPDQPLPTDVLTSIQTDNPIERPSPILAHDKPQTSETTEQERSPSPNTKRDRQREANRLAALRSRGKKKGEVAVLEQTITTIQQENARLRGRLERLLALAGNGPLAGAGGGLGAEQSVASGSGFGNQAPSSRRPSHMEEQPDHMPGSAGLSSYSRGQSQPREVTTTVDLGQGMSVDLDLSGRQVENRPGESGEGTGDTEDLVVNGNNGINDSARPAPTSTQTQVHTQEQTQPRIHTWSGDLSGQDSITSGINADLGLNLERLLPLQRELDNLRRRLEQRSEIGKTSTALGNGDESQTVAMTEGSASASDSVVIDEEKTALVAHVRYLKEENDRIERQRKTLEREIHERKVLLESRARSGLSDGAEQLGSASGAGPDKGTADGTGVERALLGLRGWLDGALKTWTATGILQVPPERANPIPLPVSTVTRKTARPRKERTKRRDQGSETLADGAGQGQGGPEVDTDANRDIAINLNDQEIRRDGPEQDDTINAVDPDLVAAVHAHNAATGGTHDEEAQAQQNLQRILAMYSAGAASGDGDSNGDVEGRDDGQEGDQDIHMQDIASTSQGADFLAYLARETRRT